MLTKTILIADDEPDVLMVLEKRLTDEGFSVIKAECGDDALMLARSQHPDLAILDILMPGMDGGQVANELKQHNTTANIPIMFISALYSRNEENYHGHEVGGNVIFAKPYNMDELVKTAKKLI